MQNLAHSKHFKLLSKRMMLDNQPIVKHQKCPEQDSNLHASQHSHLKRARLPFRHPGIVGCFGSAKVQTFFEIGGNISLFFCYFCVRFASCDSAE